MTHVTHVLIVDDNADNLRVMQRMLALEDIDGTICDSGESALAAASDDPTRFDLMLLDLSMPGMDGWQTAAAFRADARLRDLPIIAVTGHLTRTEILRAQEAGCQDVVSKPVDYYVLIEKIRRHTRLPATA